MRQGQPCPCLHLARSAVSASRIPGPAALQAMHVITPCPDNLAHFARCLCQLVVHSCSLFESEAPAVLRLIASDVLPDSQNLLPSRALRYNLVTAVIAWRSCRSAQFQCTIGVCRSPTRSRTQIGCYLLCNEPSISPFLCAQAGT